MILRRCLPFLDPFEIKSMLLLKGRLSNEVDVRHEHQPCLITYPRGTGMRNQQKQGRSAPSSLVSFLIFISQILFSAKSLDTSVINIKLIPLQSFLQFLKLWNRKLYNTLYCSRSAFFSEQASLSTRALLQLLPSTPKLFISAYTYFYTCIFAAWDLDGKMYVCYI